MPNIGPLELIVILAIVVLLFGAKKIPDLAKGLGLGIKEFKKASREVEETKKELGDDSEASKNDEKDVADPK